MLSKATRYYPLGAYRLLLAFFIAVQHTQNVFGAQQFLPFGAELGRMALVVFFVIAGWVNAQTMDSYRERPWALFANRLLRLYPIVVLALLVAVLVEWLLPRPGRPVLQFLPPLSAENLLANFLAPIPFAKPLLTRLLEQPPYNLLPVAWSLRVVFAYYGVLVLILWLVRPHQPRPSAFFWAMVGLFLLYALLSYGFALPAAFSSLLDYAPAFILGHCLHHYEMAPSKRLAALMVLAALLLLVRFDLYGAVGHIAEATISDFVRPAGLLQSAFLLCCLLPLWGLRRLRLGKAAERLDRYLGDLSLPFFLLHFQMLQLFSRSLQDIGWIRNVAAILSALLLSLVALHLVERPLARWRKRRFAPR